MQAVENQRKKSIDSNEDVLEDYLKRIKDYSLL